MRPATPFLTFQKRQAKPALDFYRSVFDDYALISLTEFEQPELLRGTVMLAEFSVKGLTIKCSDSSIDHAFDFTPSISFFIDCQDEAELRRVAAHLSDGGQVYMPIDNYGFSRLFAWVGDPFGITWQLNLT